MAGEEARRQKRTTIEDVAQHARVSRAAVSKVLRNAYGVSEEMRERVTSSIEALQYRPRISARGMRGRTFTIGVVVNDITNNFIAEVLNGTSSAIAGTPFQRIIAIADARAASYPAIESLYDRQVDGIIAISPLAEAEWLDDMGRKVPLVQIGVHQTSDSYDTIVGNDVQGVALMMNHLMGLGHRRIAHVTHSDPLWISLSNRPHIIRQNEYTRIMREAGLASEISVITARFEEGVSYTESRRAFEDGLRPTAVFAGNDDAAFGTMRAAAEFPELEQMSISGYDDSHISANPRLGLTTINQNGPEMGRRAIELLLERVEGRQESRYIQVETRLVVRTSTFPPPR
ncbi:LacI family DNA-binding transcriptional regulator [Parafrigoribacterium humi]|uniref:LacI family DNA-binding transcriptional regulator n=1 Tax=Parafrigoribacterium humi TaxID=3144664 RepID=UPI0032F02334